MNTAEPQPTREQKLDAIYALAHELFENGDYARAADLFRYMIVVEPLREDGWWGLGACHERLEDYEIACEIYETGFELGSIDLGLRWADVRLQIGDDDGAREVLEQVLEQDDSETVVAAVRAMERAMTRRTS